MPTPIPEPNRMLKPAGRERSLVSAATAGEMETAQMEKQRPPRNAVARRAGSLTTVTRSSKAAAVPMKQIWTARFSPNL